MASQLVMLGHFSGVPQPASVAPSGGEKALSWVNLRFEMSAYV